ncbi:glycosyltransferase family 2 protein [Limosilactobacillus kribbianus]|uniref:glycosyltransferase family 2 protein n=1 Tax=Limosilactobacillus kribbianus TaxID=2982695 RepID=UPI002265080A|nr:glycosyltransferase [Limosilactobacillus kribbianus]
MPVLSIIIPNYNSGSALENCLQSITEKNTAEIQIIVVDDGSTDGSAASAETLDKRIEVIRQANQGVSVARNNGLKHVQSDYVMFVDADDRLDPEWSRYVLPKLKQGEDLFLFNYFNSSTQVQIIDRSADLIGTDFANYRLKMLTNPTKFMTVWGKVLRTKVIQNNQLVFNSQLRLAEDGDFMVRYLLHAQNICVSEEYLYHYQNNEHSVMRSFDSNKANDYLTALEITRRAVRQSNNQSLIHAYSFYILMHLNVMMVRDVFNIDNQEPLTAKMNRLKAIIAKPIIKEALNDVRLSECRSPRTVPILLLKTKMDRLAALAFIARSKQNHQKK